MLTALFTFFRFLTAPLDRPFEPVDQIAKLWRRSIDANDHDAILMIYHGRRCLLTSLLVAFAPWNAGARKASTSWLD